MKRLLMLMAFAVAGVLSGDDLAWRFDTSGRPADVRQASASAANADAWALQPVRSEASSATMRQLNPPSYVTASNGSLRDAVAVIRRKTPFTAFVFSNDTLVQSVSSYCDTLVRQFSADRFAVLQALKGLREP